MGNFPQNGLRGSRLPPVVAGYMGRFPHIKIGPLPNLPRDLRGLD